MELADDFKRNLIAGVIKEVKKGKNTGMNKPKGQFSIGIPSFEVGKHFFKDIGCVTTSTKKKEIHELNPLQTTAFLGIETVEVNFCGKVWSLAGSRPKAGSMKIKAIFDKFSVVIEPNMVTCKFVTMAEDYGGPGSLRKSTDPY